MSINKTTLDFNFEGSPHQIEIDECQIVQQVINFDFISEESDRRNLYMLMNRESGSHLYCDEKGNLQTITGLKKRITYFFNKNKELKKIKKCLEKLFKKIDLDLQKLPVNGNSNFSQVHAMAISHFFDKKGKIGRLSTHIFDFKSLADTNHLEQYVFFNKPAIRLKFKSDASSWDILEFESPSIRSALEKTPLSQDTNFPLDGHNIFNLSINEINKSHNLFMLLSRKKGELFFVDKEGRLKKVSSLKDRIKHVLFKKQELTKVHDVVTDLLDQIEIFAQKYENNLIFRAFLQEIFNPSKGNISTLSSKIFDRWHIKENSSLEAVLSIDQETDKSALLTCREDFKSALKSLRDSTPLNYDKNRQLAIEAFTRYSRAEFEFTKSLGIELKEAGGGSGGARFGYHRFHKKEIETDEGNVSVLDGRIFVIKPGDEGPHGENNPQWYAPIKKTLISPKRCLFNNSEPLAEVHSYLLDKTFKLNIVPPTIYEKVKSSKFHGQSTKDCSLQMFVEKSHTLAEELGISEAWKMLPRRFLRWYFKRHKNEIEKKLPQILLEKIATHNFLIEDIDCHFGNIMVKHKTVSHKIPKTLLTKENLFVENRVLPKDEELEHFVNNFFSSVHEGVAVNQLFLQEIFASENDTILIKHDGGASHPNLHPTGYLSLRFKHLFEVLPHCVEDFSEETTKIFNEKHDEFLNYLLEKTTNEISNIVQVDLWNELNVKLSELVKMWALNLDAKEEQAEIIKLLIETETESLKSNVYSVALSKEGAGKKRALKELDSTLKNHKQYYEIHFERIKGTITTRMDSWKIFIDHIAKENEKPNRIRDLLSIRSFYQFRRHQQALEKKLPSQVKDFTQIIQARTPKKTAHALIPLQND